MDPRNRDIIPASPLERFKPLQENLQKRLNTFKNYPQKAVKEKVELADNGFFYTGDGKTDRVQCAFCGIIIDNWQTDDDIQTEHRKFSSTCPRVIDLDRRNFGANLDMGGSRLDLIKNNQNAAASGRVPQMKDYSLRLKSFHDWKYSEKEKPSPESLAKAGLFYIGRRFGLHVSQFLFLVPNRLAGGDS
jgi:hypothetical protein